MCGICGIVASPASSLDMDGTVRKMVSLLRHRGPDDSGTWVQGPVALGHARLSIIDLSPLGRQPMVSPSTDWVITYNGETYNFGSLRNELETTGVVFRGRSDSEVLAAALDAWGFHATLARMRGMYAIAAWHIPTRKLYLARDPLGQKPLFYGWCGDTFVFGSELKTLKALNSRPPVDRNSVAKMLRYSCVPAPHTIYQGVYKLPPASFLVFCEETRKVSQPQRLWRPNPQDSEPANLKGAVALLEDAVKLRMVSDVPLGAFLSGGVDSTLITAMMQRASSTPVQSFTIGFEDETYNEGEQARLVAEYLGTAHTELRFSEKDALDIVPRLGDLYDEPFGDPSQVPTVLLCQLARQHVTVALSGDGGDELFRGYNRSVWLPKLHRVMRHIPRLVRIGLAGLLRHKSTQGAVDFLSRAGLLKTRLLHDKLKKLANLMAADNFRLRYRALLSEWTNQGLVRGAAEDDIDEFREISSSLSLEDQLMLADYFFYLPDDILVKVDRASMSTGLEVRSPLLDHELVNYCSRIPASENIQGRQGKQLLRRMLSEFVPAHLFERPKMGFAAPIKSWLQGDLKEWGASLLNTHWVRDGNLLQEAPIRHAWRDLQAGRSDTSHKLWNVLMVVAWLENQQHPT